MATKADIERRDEKARRVKEKIVAMAANRLLIGMLDEWKLDLLLIALGDGEVVVRKG